MNSRLEKIRRIIQQKELDGVFISDPVNRRYLSGFTGSTGYLLITRTRRIFIADFRYVQQAKQQCEGFEVVELPRDILEKINELAIDLNIRDLGFEDGHISFMQYAAMKEKLEKTYLHPLGDAINHLRMTKNDDEIRLIKTAVNITEKAVDNIKSYIKPGIREREIALEIEYFMRKMGASAAAFDFIVASGWRSALPHGVASDKTVQEGEFITLDIGCKYEGYCSDMTRTFAVGNYTPKQREIYDIVLEAQTQALSLMKPGMTGVEVDGIARDVIEKAGYGEYFGHGLGHGVGLQIHEAPALSQKGKIVLEPGMMVTVEPGIYLPDFGGVRIEDLVVIKENGIENLNSSSKELTTI